MEGGRDGWMDGWMDGWLDGWMDVCMNGWLVGWLVGWTRGEERDKGMVTGIFYYLLDLELRVHDLCHAESPLDESPRHVFRLECRALLRHNGRRGASNFGEDLHGHLHGVRRLLLLHLRH